MTVNRLHTVIYVLLLAGLGITLFLVYTDSDSAWAFPFLVGYVGFLFLFMLYFAVLVFFRMRRLKGSEIRKRIGKAAGYFLSILAFHYLMHLFGWKEAEWLGVVITSLGISLSLSFLDLVFMKGDADGGK